MENELSHGGTEALQLGRIGHLISNEPELIGGEPENRAALEVLRHFGLPLIRGLLALQRPPGVQQPVEEPLLALSQLRGKASLRELLREAVDVDDAPTAVRFAKGAVPADVEAIDTVGTCDVLARGDQQDVLVLAVGSMVPTCLAAAEQLSARGLGVTVVDPRWVKPFDPAVVALAAEHRLVVTVEDNGRTGGVGAAFTQALRDLESEVPVRVHGVAQEFLDHAKRPVILERLGLTPDAVAADTHAAWLRLTGNNADV